MTWQLHRTLQTPFLSIILHRSRNLSLLFFWSAMHLYPSDWHLSSIQRINDWTQMKAKFQYSTPLWTLRISFNHFLCKTQLFSISSSVQILHVQLNIPSHPLTLLCVSVFERVFFFSVSAENTNNTASCCSCGTLTRNSSSRAAHTGAAHNILFTRFASRLYMSEGVLRSRVSYSVAQIRLS